MSVKPCALVDLAACRKYLGLPCKGCTLEGKVSGVSEMHSLPGAFQQLGGHAHTVKCKGSHVQSVKCTHRLVHSSSWVAMCNARRSKCANLSGCSIACRCTAFCVASGPSMAAAVALHTCMGRSSS
eukprot:1139081-Pelagomonas_calceolata.AAC.1